jgi:3',5'-nucleoside bisphosphate phosphatase
LSIQGDLHIHTTISDGHSTPEETLHDVLQAELGFFSVTDHNAIGALAIVEAALPPDGPEFIRGVEISAQPAKTTELHILGFGFDPTSEALRDLCHRVTRCKKRQLRRIVEGLQRDGLPVSQDELALGDDDNYVGRPVLAELLVSKGIVPTFSSAFARYLSTDAPAYMPMEHLHPQFAIDTIHAAGGLAVWAHPSVDDIDKWISVLIDAGMDGIEVYRPALRGNEQLYVEKAAEHFGLLVTGGSDSHSRTSSDRPGCFTVTDEQIADFLAVLRARTAG